MYRYAKWMGAEVDKNLKSTATHLIAETATTDKYFVAKHRLKIKIIRTSWVIDCWRKGVLLPEDQYLVPPLAGIIICSTGFKAPQVEKIRMLTNSNGGTFIDYLDKGVTHVVCAKVGGKKYETAKKWRTPTVSLDWLNKSVEAGGALGVEDFIVGEFLKKETPIRSTNPSLQTVEEDTRKEKLSSYLSSCRIYLHGLSAIHEEKLENIMNNTGAKRVVKSNELVTHFVAKEIDE